MWGDCLLVAVYITNKAPSKEQVFMKLPTGYKGKRSRIEVGKKGELYGKDHGGPEKGHGSITTILIYVDDMIISGNNLEEIQEVKADLAKQFHMKDMGELRYFLGIEVDQTSQGIFLSQRKYISDLLKDQGLTKCRVLKVPVDSHTKLTADQGDPLQDVVS